MSQPVVYAPRPSNGWMWIAGVVVFIWLNQLLVGFIIANSPAPLSTLWPSLLINLIITAPFLFFIFWSRHMSYTLDNEALTLKCGPILRYVIPLNTIQNVRRRNLSISMYSSFRFPGLALYSCYYTDVGTVKMCATAAAHQILLIETSAGVYGITPADEEQFVADLTSKLEV